MAFNNFHAFFSMGGYAFFVWSAYGIVGAILSINIFVPWWQKKQLRKKLIQLKEKK